MENKRITFNLEGWNIFGFKKLGMHDYDTPDKYQEAIEERVGWLLGITTKSFEKENGELLHCPCAVVEGIPDGNIYEISPTNCKVMNN